MSNFYKKIKQARGNIPRMEEYRTLDPYRHKTPGDGQGWDLNRPGNEETHGQQSGMGGGLGTRFRKDSPIDFSELSEGEYWDQVKNDIPTSTHTLMEEYATPDAKRPTDLIAFDDYRDSPFLNDLLSRKKGPPVGPHNMHNRINPIYQKLKRQIK